MDNGNSFQTDEEPHQEAPREDKRTWSQDFILIPGCLRAVLGALFGMAVTTVLFVLFFPPGGPNYGEGVGWGILFFVVVMPTGAIIGGLIAGLWGIRIT